MNRSRALALIVIAFLACRERVDTDRDAALRQSLSQLRAALAAYEAETGHYPHRLQDLVPKHLPAIPHDPITGQANWRLTTEETVQPSSDFMTGQSAAPQSVIVDVHSTAPGADATGALYANY